MNYLIKFKVTNCDSKLGHPQAVDQSFTDEFHCDGCSSQEEAECKGAELMRKRYPDCTFECLCCEEHPVGQGGGGGKVFDPADEKPAETQCRQKKPLIDKGKK